MRPDLPWNVAGIPPEAREAARAAARREGLSVGEWLTRRILSGLAGLEPQSGDGGYDSHPADNNGYAHQRIDETRRDSDVMLNRVRISESETSDIYRRIEEQLRAVGTRLESAEKKQSESNRAMNRAAVEMNVAAREQAQAFDQLADHVVKLSERMEKLENQSHAGRQNDNDGVRDAIKALHQGMARLADQIANTAGQSETQIKTLSDNMEALAARLGQTRRDSEIAASALETRLGALNERMLAAETSVQSLDGKQLPDFETALAELAASVRRLEERRPPDHSDAIAALTESLHQLETRGPDPAIDRRLSGIERTLGDLIGRLDSEEPPANPRMEETLSRLTRRLDSVETDMREALAEIRKLTEGRIAVPPPPASPLPPPPVQGFADAPAPHSGPPPFADGPQFDGGAMVDPLPQAGFDPLGGPAAGGNGYGESYLAAARRSAIAAQSEAERHGGAFSGFSWGSSASGPVTAPPKRRLSIGIAVLALVVVIAAIASTILSHRLPHGTTDNAPIAKTVAAKPAPMQQSDSTDPAAGPASDGAAETDDAAASDAPPPAPAKSQTAGTGVTGASKLLVMAKAGNAKAALVLGLTHLEGDGVPANPAEAVKWLNQAAGAGEPVAQYRLAVMLENGRGVKADPAQAVKLYLAAANQGNRKAMHNLASAYALGKGTEKNYVEAARWFQRAANLGVRDSQFNLAVLYERGLGLARDPAAAYKWYAIASAGGDGEAKNRMDALLPQLAPAALGAAQDAARSFKPAPMSAGANVAPTAAAFGR